MNVPTVVLAAAMLGPNDLVPVPGGVMDFDRYGRERFWADIDTPTEEPVITKPKPEKTDAVPVNVGKDVPDASMEPSRASGDGMGTS